LKNKRSFCKKKKTKERKHRWHNARHTHQVPKGFIPMVKPCFPCLCSSLCSSIIFKFSPILFL
jgi:hypothetical protein